MSDILLPLLALVGVFGIFFLLVVGAGLWEKRPIQPYYVPAKGEAYKPSSIAAEANREAKSVGLRHAALCHDAKGKLYRVRYDFWISPKCRTIANIGSGTVAGISVNGVWLYSRTQDGRILLTTNEIGEQDISGVEEQVTWTHLKLVPLFKKHAARLTDVAVEPFDADSALAGYFDIRRRKADALVERGYAYYLDDEQMAWRHTLKGAIVIYFITVWVRPIRRLLRTIGLVRD